MEIKIRTSNPNNRRNTIPESYRPYKEQTEEQKKILEKIILSDRARYDAASSDRERAMSGSLTRGFFEEEEK